MSLRTLIAALAVSAALAGTAVAQNDTSGTTAPPACSCPGHQAGSMGMGTGTGSGAGMGSGSTAGSMPMHGMCGQSQMQMGQMANVTVQDTPQGAIVRFDAKNPSQVNSIRGMAQQMSSCMNPCAQGSTTPSR
ncbi:MAG: hypothetical protein QM765_23410 [Myxococcales bacterium]